MPSYVYRCDECGVETEVYHSMTEPRPSECGEHGVMRIVVGALGMPGMKVKNEGTGYQPGLARRPNDPEAWVDSKRDLARLIDKRKRQAERRGYELRVGNAADMAGNLSPPETKPVTLQDVIREEGGA